VSLLQYLRDSEEINKALGPGVAIGGCYRYWCMRERSSRSGMASPSPLDGYKAPYPPQPSSRDLFPSIVPVNSQTASFLTALLAGPGFGRPPRQLRYHLPAPPSITFLSPPDPPHTRSLVLSFDHPSARCRVGGLQLTLTTMACLNPSSQRPVYRRDSP
jgi:hypothetical protein